MNILSGRGPRQAFMAHIRLYLLFKCNPVMLQASNAQHIAGCCPTFLAAGAVPTLQDSTATPPCTRTPCVAWGQTPVDSDA